MFSRFNIFAKTCNFNFLTFFVIIQVFLASGVRTPPLRFDNKLLENFFGLGFVFNFLSQNLAIFLIKRSIFQIEFKVSPASRVI